MSKSVRGRTLAIIIALLLPLVVMGLQNTVTQPLVWIVYADGQDASIEVAAQTFSQEMTMGDCIVRETTLSRLELIPLYSDAIVLIGHGQSEGLEVLETIIPWKQINDALEERKSQLIMLLACDSPSNPDSMIYGFSGQIDAKSGALIAAWKVMETISPNNPVNIAHEAIIEAQVEMTHPLGTYVYFVHGYAGDNSGFDDMRSNLLDLGQLYDGYDFFSYLEEYPSMSMFDIHNIEGGISTYAENFKNALILHPPGTQIDVVAHSLGGIITREMVRLYRSDLESEGIEIGRVITLGTPHYGTEVTDYEFLPIVVSALVSIRSGTFWFTDVFRSLNPQSTFMSILNNNPASYSSGIEWYGIGGIDTYWGSLLMGAGVHSYVNDIMTTTVGSVPPLYTDYQILTADHNKLVWDEVDGLSYPYVENWLAGGIDSDGDGIIDAEELHVTGTDPLNPDPDNDNLLDPDELEWGTDPYDSDTDNDGILDGYEISPNPYVTNPLQPDSDFDTLSDYDEIFIHGSNPLTCYTDGDILSDPQEVAWGYDPDNTNDPINAQELTYSAWQVNGVTGYVRANHYTAMDYVKVYVKYKNSYGQWTAYFYVGTDSSPYYYGDYYISWSLLQGYVQMCVNVQAFNSGNLFLGSDHQYVTLPGSGGGKPGGDPVPE